MKKTLLLSLGVLISSLGVAQTNCGTAVLVDVGTHSVGNLVGVPYSQICIDGPSASMANWYKLNLSTEGNHLVQVTTILPQNTGKDTRVHIYSGSCEGTLTCVTGNDDAQAYLSRVNFVANSGLDYFIVFDNRWQNSSNFDFQITAEPIGGANPFTPVSFTNVSNPLNTEYRTISADMNNDGLDDLVGISPGRVQIMYQTESGTFRGQDFAIEANFTMPSWSAAVADFNKDGFGDILLGGGSYASILQSTEEGSSFAVFNSSYVFSQRTNFVDINNDGHLDAFICHDVAPNIYYLNDGQGGWLFNQGGLGDVSSGGNYGSIWLDYDDDGDVDLFIAKCRGGNTPAKYNELHRNNGDGTFSQIAAEISMNHPNQNWSSAWGDYNNDGIMDVMIGAYSTSDGFHLLLQGNGDGTFADITSGSGIDTYNKFAIEYLAHDFNNDGFIDIFTGSGDILYNNGDFTFSSMPINASQGSVGDFNNDGFLDIMNQSSLRINQANDHNWLKISLRGIESTQQGIGARVEIHGPWGVQVRNIVSGDGFRYMSTLNAHFGIGNDEVIDVLLVKWPSGTVDRWTEVEPNQHLILVEGSTTLSNDEVTNVSFALYPNPVNDYLVIDTPVDILWNMYEIYSVDGKLVSKGGFTDRVGVSNLSTGTFIVQLFNNKDLVHTHKMTKK